MFVFPQPQYVSCDECGACVPKWEADEHECDREKWLDFQIVKLRPEIAAFEHDFYTWLALAPEGRFERYWAERQRLRSEILNGSRSGQRETVAA